MEMYECSECQDKLEIPEDCSNEELFLIEEDWVIDDGAGMDDRSSKIRGYSICVIIAEARTS